MVTVGLKEALQPSLEAWGSRAPLSQSQDARSVVAGSVQQFVETAGTRLLATAVRQRLCVHPKRQQCGRQQ